MLKVLLELFTKIYETEDDRIELSKIFYNNTFVSIDVLHELELNDLNHIYIDEKYFELSVYYYDITNIDEYLLKIIKIIHLIKEINNKYEPNNTLKYNIIIFLGNQKKIFMGDKITPISMNSGSAIVEVYVSLWRKEEFEKVLIHELLHFINADFFYNNKGYSELDNNILELIKIEGVNNPNESYNETLAGIINMCWKSVQLKIDINEIYFIDMKFLYLQSAKLIKYFGGLTNNDLLDKQITIKQTTSAISYLFLKMILFHNIIDTLEFIDDINFKCNNTDKINKFNVYLIDKIKDKSYSENVDKYLIFINKPKIDYSKYIYKNMRMSVY